MHQETQNHVFKFSIHLYVRKCRENYRQIYGKSKASLWRIISSGTPPNFLGQSFALYLQFAIDIFFRTAFLRKLLEITFSFKHCNFSRVFLLVKMASKTMTRSIFKKAQQTIRIICLALMMTENLSQLKGLCHGSPVNVV